METNEFIEKWMELVGDGKITTVQDYSFNERISPITSKRKLEGEGWAKLPIGKKFIYIKRD